MNSIESIYDMTAQDLRDEVVGHSIVSINTITKTIVLDNGTTLEIEDYEGCCAWFGGELEVIDLDENVITRIEQVDSTAVETGLESWSLHIYTAHKLIAKVNIDGDPANGMYGSSVNLLVKKAA